MLTVGELIEQLEDFDEYAEVRIASQPNWPMEYSASDQLSATEAGTVVYIAEAGQLGYLPGEVARELGW